MKKILNIAACLSIIVLAGSCKKDVTLNSLDQATPETYFHSGKDITAAIAGMYASFQVEMIGSGSTAKSSAYADPSFGGFYHYWGEGRSDDFDRSGYPNATINELAANNITYTNNATDWGGLYRTIFRANIAIKYVPQVAQYDNTVTPAIINNALAQAYAMRAESYFYIVRLWGDAPIWKEPYVDITQSALKARSPQAKIIDSVIIPDLLHAYQLQTPLQTPVVWNIGEGAICSMLADVYAWKHDYTNAKLWMDNLFKAKSPTGKTYNGQTGSGGDLETAANWKNQFLTPATSFETIWSIHWDYNVNGCACIPPGPQTTNNPIQVDSLLQARWKAFKLTDTRVLKSIDTLTTNNHANETYKFYNFQGGLPAVSTGFTTQTTNVFLPMYRLGGMYLLYAETVNQLGDLPTALKYLNFVHQRAGLSPFLATDAEVSNKTAMAATILQERQYELYAEGVRWFDLIRTGNVQNMMDPVLIRRQRDAGSPQIGFGDLRKIYWPVSQNALHANNLLTQTPGY